MVHSHKSVLTEDTRAKGSGSARLDTSIMTKHIHPALSDVALVGFQRFGAWNRAVRGLFMGRIQTNDPPASQNRAKRCKADQVDTM